MKDGNNCLRFTKKNTMSILGSTYVIINFERPQVLAFHDLSQHAVSPMRFSLHTSVLPLIIITAKRITHIRYNLNKKRHDLKNREFSASTISDLGETTLIGLVKE
uniref:Uncharacterized protein n=1 Tax=Candidozyma auris TaxID=498019 RepID=A0A0L0NPA5_CANAR